MGFTKSVLTENPWSVTLKVIKGILDLSLESVGSRDAIYCAAYWKGYHWVVNESRLRLFPPAGLELRKGFSVL